MPAVLPARVVRPRRLVVPVAIVAAVLLVGPTAPSRPAEAASDVPLAALQDGRVAVTVPSALRGERVTLTLNGRTRTVAGRPATFSVSELRNATDGGWHRLELRSGARTATARFMVARRTDRRVPTLVMTGAPARTDAPATATFRYSSSDGTVSCTVDGRPVTCSSRTATVTVRPGRHVFALRARNDYGAATLTRTWHVATPRTDASPTGASAPGAGGPTTPTETTAVTTPASPSSGSGPAAGSPSPATSGSPRWRLLVSEDFNGTELDDDRWYTYGPNWPGHAGNGLRDGSAVSVGGGLLTITAQMVNGTLVSGAAASTIDQTYGRIEFRARTDADPSETMSGVGLTWPQSNRWPIDGEINIYETGTETRSFFRSYLHYGARNDQYWFDHNANSTQWHTMAMEWTPTAVRFFRDGLLEGVVTDPIAIPRVPHHLVFQLDPFKPTMTGVVRMQVDDVRIYALDS